MMEKSFRYSPSNPWKYRAGIGLLLSITGLAILFVTLLVYQLPKVREMG
jgi:hypothetical protein